MDTKSLSSRQVWWAQKLSKYHFQIDYCQGKANRAANALSCFPQQNQAKEDELRAENTRIFHKLQSSLTSASLSVFSIGSKANMSPLYHVFIYRTHVLPQLHQFWNELWAKPADEASYKISISEIRLRLAELQEFNEGARKIRATEERQEGWEDINRVLHHQRLLFVPKTIRTELISHHYNDPLAGHFGINKTKELISRKYY